MNRQSRLPGRSHRRTEARDADRGRSDQPGRSGTRVISSRSLLALLGGELVSRLGSQLTYLALPWFVLVTTGSPTRMGLVLRRPAGADGAARDPCGLRRPAARPEAIDARGGRCSRPDRRLVPFLNAVGGLTFPLILVVAALLGAFSCAYFTCQRLILPAVVGEDEQRLAQANSLVEGTTNVTNLLGPALAGILIALMGAANVMWLDALSFALAFVLIGLFVDAGHDVNGEDGDAGGVWAGLAYLRRDLLVARVSLSSDLGSLSDARRIPPVLAFEQTTTTRGSRPRGGDRVGFGLLAWDCRCRECAWPHRRLHRRASLAARPALVRGRPACTPDAARRCLIRRAVPRDAVGPGSGPSAARSQSRR